MSNELAPLTAPDSTERQRLHQMLSEFLITVEDKMFQNKDIYIDGYRFINCSFLNCTLHVFRGTFEFHHCLFNNNKRIFYEDSQKTVQLFIFGDPKMLAGTTGFDVKKYPDGTISIGKGATI